jgi:hypothetical protein
LIHEARKMGRQSQNLTAPKPSGFAGVMDKFKLEPIRIGKEHGSFAPCN